MSPVAFVAMTDRTHADDVLRMMHALYAPDEPAARDRFPRTIDTLLADPSRGRIVLIDVGGRVGGYALLIPYWSNEFGGTLLFIDEIFVEETFRGQGIARSLFEFVATTRPFDAVALALEVAPYNTRARALYERVGFVQREARMMTRTLASAV